MKRFTIILGCIILLPQVAKADIIFFKDGMKTVCRDRAWEEGQEVKCEYDGMILSYQKKDVQRIEKTLFEKKSEPSLDKIKTAPKATEGSPTETRKKKATLSQQKPLAEKNISKTVSNDNSGAAQTGGLEFYNPRRPHKYWISASAKYQSFEKAIAALAKQYDRSPGWIKQHMGEINDLDKIHRNLASGKLNTPDEIKPDPVKGISETLFYNPRRPQKYWTGSTSKHKTFQQAVSALAKQYGRSQEWVQQHMGNSNNLNEIHQNLTNRKLAETSP